MPLRPGESVKALKTLFVGGGVSGRSLPRFPCDAGCADGRIAGPSRRVLMRHTEEFRYSAVLLKEARAVRFNNFVFTGQTLQVECKVKKRDETTYTLLGKRNSRGGVGGQRSPHVGTVQSFRPRSLTGVFGRTTHPETPRTLQRSLPSDSGGLTTRAVIAGLRLAGGNPQASVARISEYENGAL